MFTRRPMYVNPDPFIEERRVRLRHDALWSVVIDVLVLATVAFLVGVLIGLWPVRAQAEIVMQQGVLIDTQLTPECLSTYCGTPYSTPYSVSPWLKFLPANPFLQPFPVMPRLDWQASPNGHSRDAETGRAIMPSMSQNPESLTERPMEGVLTQGGGAGGWGGGVLIAPTPSLPPVDCYEGEVCQ